MKTNLLGEKETFLIKEDFLLRLGSLLGRSMHHREDDLQLIANSVKSASSTLFICVGDEAKFLRAGIGKWSIKCAHSQSIL